MPKTNPSVFFRQVELPTQIPGQLFLHSLPGVHQPLEQVWQVARQIPLSAIVRLTELEETRLKSPEYFEAIFANQTPSEMLACPTPDFGIPPDRDAFWLLACQVTERLRAGERILVHCGAGIGRTGMFAIAVLLALGQPLSAAELAVHVAGAGTEVESQRALIDWCAQQLPVQVVLRPLHPADLPILFEFHRDPQAVYMAAFTAPNPNDRAAFDAHFLKIMADPTVILRTIIAEGQVAGVLFSFIMASQREVGYWLGREFWGRGIATAALRLFLNEITKRPLFARVAKDNLGSLRVLEKSGFTIMGEDKGYANARAAEIEEWLLHYPA